MSSKRRSTAWPVGLGIAAAALLGGTSTTWACVPQPLITLTPMSSGPAGSDLTANGYAVNGRAEIRWNALDGPLLATAQGPVFSAPVKIPDAPPGLYTVLVLERGAGGALGSTGRAAFQITSDSQSAAAPAPRPTPPTRSASVPTGAAVAGGAGLLTLGAIGGMLAARRLSRRSASDQGV